MVLGHQYGLHTYEPGHVLEGERAQVGDRPHATLHPSSGRRNLLLRRSLEEFGGTGHRASSSQQGDSPPDPIRLNYIWMQLPKRALGDYRVLGSNLQRKPLQRLLREIQKHRYILLAAIAVLLWNPDVHPHDARPVLLVPHQAEIEEAVLFLIYPKRKEPQQEQDFYGKEEGQRRTEIKEGHEQVWKPDLLLLVFALL
eukprot:CAMPEP_0170499778 /NCGR_PEP_ID=MMETSP0208-20121228/32545_1 /TAXON_ID=197538 /ORGANISM="Strombidium inclinatum, Strain S3" /LENGTH=197 /DNA_ID=CAMNT_0010777489 /DNA_START=553 /DNA_END=1146 /DNA_ORIENTATION=+